MWTRWWAPGRTLPPLHARLCALYHVTQAEPVSVAMRGCATRHESYLLTISSLCAISAYDMPALAATWPRVPAATRRHGGFGSAATAYVPPCADVCACVRVSLARYSFCPAACAVFRFRGRTHLFSEGEFARNFAAPSSAIRGARGEEEPRAPTGPDF